jgi:hypothetical protein
VETIDEPFFTALEDVYHLLDDCPLGRRIPPELRQPGTGGRELCPACEAREEARRRLTPRL